LKLNLLFRALALEDIEDEEEKQIEQINTIQESVNILFSYFNNVRLMRPRKLQKP